MPQSTAHPQGKTVFTGLPQEAGEAENKYTEAALKRHKIEGLELAVRARWIAMALIAVLLVFLNPNLEVLYYHAILALLAANGWLMRRVGRVGQSRKELALIFGDLVLMTVGMVGPNPLSETSFPLAMQYRLEYFQYFFVILAAGTLAYSWRTVIAIGIWTSVIWGIGVAAVWWFAAPVPELTGVVQQGFAAFPGLAEFMDPNNLNIKLRMQEIVVFLIVAVTLGISVRRFNKLLISNAGLERERANLSRYFSPNVVEELSQNDEPLKQIRTHDVAVLFIDIVDFTSFSASREPQEVIEVLRQFHGRMEAEVFRHEGTLDKYLGDGLMATFGTPFVRERDATRAMECVRAMVAAMESWNAERRRVGVPEICVGIGLHYGTVVLGDIGAHRLEFAVIGNTVNVSSRLEALTRKLEVRAIISDEMRNQFMRDSGGSGDSALLHGFERCPDQDIRGVQQKMTVWALK